MMVEPENPIFNRHHSASVRMRAPSTDKSRHVMNADVLRTFSKSLWLITSLVGPTVECVNVIIRSAVLYFVYAA